jgi:hypothetical protein
MPFPPIAPPAFGLATSVHDWAGEFSLMERDELLYERHLIATGSLPFSRAQAAQLYQQTRAQQIRIRISRA